MDRFLYAVAEIATVLWRGTRPARRWLGRAAGIVFAYLLLALLIPATAVHVTVNMATTAPPAGPPVQICGSSLLNSPWNYNGASGPYSSGTPGLPTFGAPSTDFPNATAGDVLPAGTADYPSFDLADNTVYYLAPGVHIGQIQARTGDVFVGGDASGTTSILSGNYSTSRRWGIDSNSTDGNQAGVTIEYLTMEEYEPFEDQSATNPDGNTGWTVKYNTITHNVPGAGIQATTTSDIEYNCLTENGQYGINAGEVNGFGVDSLTGGPYAITISNDEISHNDTCDIEGLLTNAAAGYTNYNPVPPAYQNPHCTDQGPVTNDGNWGGFKLWRTNAVVVENDWIHDNYGVGGWADTDNVNTTWENNYIAHNDYEGIIEEVSYNFKITGNTLIQNDWIGGLGNPTFPQAAVYVSESGSDTVFGGVPACSEPECSGFPAYVSQSLVSYNALTDNGGGVFLWENAGRYCSSGLDGVCTLVDGGAFTLSNCGTNFTSTANVDTTTYAGDSTGSPAANWWDGCQWETANVSVTGNTITLNPADLPGCNVTAWPACGANGIFSDYVNPAQAPPWAVGSMITFFRSNTWSGNVYTGPPNFQAWQQGNPVSSANWTGALGGGDKCSNGTETTTARCTGPFGQDTGSVFYPVRPHGFF